MSRFAKTFNRSQNSAGFTLPEVLVAFLILAISLGVLWPSFGGNLASLDASTFHALALAEARSQIDRLGAEIPLEEGELAGETEAGLSWIMRLHQDESLSSRPMDQSDGPYIVPYVIEVVVTDQADRKLTITTLRLASVEEGWRSVK
jgi:general secretion pathway protein I